MVAKAEHSHSFNTEGEQSYTTFLAQNASMIKMTRETSLASPLPQTTQAEPVRFTGNPQHPIRFRYPIPYEEAVGGEGRTYYLRSRFLLSSPLSA